VTAISGHAVVIADSIGAGLFARYDYGKPLKREESQKLFDIIMGSLDGLMFNIQNYFTKMGESSFVAKDFSGYSGKGGAEHPEFKSLMSHFKVEGEVFDASIIGSNVSMVKNHLAELQQQMKDKKPEEVKLVIFALGSNDLCAPTQLKDGELRKAFADYYLASINEVRKTFTEADIYIISPLPVQKLIEVTKEGKITMEGLSQINPLGAAALGMNNDATACATIQTLYCPALTMPGAQANIELMLQGIKDAMWNISSEFAKDGKQKLYFSDLTGATISTDHLALDCFHPNIKGQAFLAEKAWENFKQVLAGQ
jgi:lysophospholipase L1-like esterase